MKGPNFSDPELFRAQEPPAAAVDLINSQRRRQISNEGGPAAHDDDHVDRRPNGASIGWTCDPKWRKRYSRRRNLEHAEALTIAEIERLQRTKLSDQHVRTKLAVIFNALVGTLASPLPHSLAKGR